ncbi:MAG: hypothetical protein ABJB01_13085 [Rudaea sp.]
MKERIVALTIGLAAFLGSAFATDASASLPDLLFCHGCTPGQLDSAILADPSPIGTIIYVGDTASGAIGAYHVYADVDDSRHPPVHTRQIENVSANPSLTAGINSGIQFYNMAPIGWHKRYNENYPDTSKNIYNFVDAGPDQNAFNASVNTGMTGLNVAGKQFGVIMSQVHLGDPSTIADVTTTEAFADGSHVNLVWDKSSGTQKLDPDSARDSDYNNIPYVGADGKIHSLGGKHAFSDDTHGVTNYNNFIRQVTSLGVAIVPSAPGGGSGGGTTTHGWICTEDENTKQVTCWSS